MSSHYSHLFWFCLSLPLLLLVWFPPEKTPVKAFLMKVRKLTIRCSRPTRAAHREPATPPPEGREMPLWEEEGERLYYQLGQGRA